MSAVIIEHVNIADLPEMWRAKLPAPQAARVTVRVTVRIESEAPAAAPTLASAAAFVSSDPAFGIWRDREDLSDVAAYLRKLRAPHNVSISYPA